MSRRKRKGEAEEDPFLQGLRKAQSLLYAHPLFLSLGNLLERPEPAVTDGWARLEDRPSWGNNRRVQILVNRKHRGSPEEWAYVLAIAHLHVGLGHLDPDRREPSWYAACALQAMTLAETTKVGRPPSDFRIDRPSFQTSDLIRLEAFLAGEGAGEVPRIPLISGASEPWSILAPDRTQLRNAGQHRMKAFADGLRAAVQSAVEVAGGAAPALGRPTKTNSQALRAKQWFVSRFPLLGSLAASFTVVDDAEVCQALGVGTAAVNPSVSEIYINPKAMLSPEELKLVMAHEMLHVGLRHEARCQGRDSYLWNVACDYVINAWLIEMDIGEIPRDGILYDASLAGRSAEDIYDEIVRNLRWRRKLAKLRTPKGVGESDIIDDRPPRWWTSGAGVDLDAFYRRALREGLDLHQRGECRGLLPAGLVEEIKALSQPPIPWDVKLAQWLDAFFPALDRRRTYSRASRRQSSTPDIPRPRWFLPEELTTARTFGVVLDTSGSMSRRELGLGLGAIASYAHSREVPAVRVVYCDAAPTDAGYIRPEDLVERVRVTGRGGTVLQPGIDLLIQVEDFPKAGPILMITDGYCEPLRIPRDHAFLLSRGGRLPFPPKGPVFVMD